MPIYQHDKKQCDLLNALHSISSIVCYLSYFLFVVILDESC